MSVVGFIKQRPLLSFFALAFLFGWIWGIPIARLTSGGTATLATVSPLVFLFLFLGEAGSGVVGIILAGIVGGRDGVRDLLSRFKRWRVGWPWYIISIFTTAIATLIVLLTLSAAISQDFMPAILRTNNVLALAAIAFAVGLPAGITEEWGWAGYALPRLLAKYRAFTAALLLALVWSAWHILIIFWAFPPFPQTGTMLDLLGGLVWIDALIPFRILMSWVYVNTKGSLLLQIIMHVFYDSALALLLPQSTLSPLGIVQFFAGLNVVLWVFVTIVVAIFGTGLLIRRVSRPY